MSKVVELYPIFNVHLFLNRFRNIDLPYRGYYQVRVRGKVESDAEVEVRAENRGGGCEDSLLSATVLGKTAVSRTVEVVYMGEEFCLRDAFIFTIRGSSTLENIRVSLDIELWYMDRQQPPRLESFTKLNSRRVDMLIESTRSVHTARLVQFDYFSFASLSIGVTAALISLLPRRRRDPPDPPFNESLCKLYSRMASQLLGTKRALHSFILSNQKYIETQLHPASLEAIETEELVAALASSPSPWKQLETDAITLSSCLSTFFYHCIELCASSEKVLSLLLRHFLCWRHRRLSEFFLRREGESPRLGLSLSSLHSTLTALPLLHSLPSHPLSSTQLDSSAESMTFILEEECIPSQNEELPSPGTQSPTPSPLESPLSSPLHSLDFSDLAVLGDYAKAKEEVKAELLSRLHLDCRLLSEWHGGQKRAARQEGTHLIVFVHGLEGASDDLLAYRVHLRHLLSADNVDFLSSRVNQGATWGDVQCLGEALLAELDGHIASMRQPPSRVSFIAHSLGGLIVRSAVSGERAAWLRPRLYTLLTLNSPHLGLVYAKKTSHLGLTLVQWYKRSECLSQLSLRDSSSFANSLLLRLASSHSLSSFRHVLLVCSYGDSMVPPHSALVCQCPAAEKDHSSLGAAYSHMLHDLQKDLANCSVIRYSVIHRKAGAKLSGRAAHTACVEDPLFAEKLLSVSAINYFR